MVGVFYIKHEKWSSTAFRIPIKSFVAVNALYSELLLTIIRNCDLGNSSAIILPDFGFANKLPAGTSGTTVQPLLPSK